MPIARHDVRAHETDVRQVEGILAVAIARVRIFLGGHGFAGQRRLVDEQILGFEQAEFGRNYVAGGKPDDISRHELLNGNFYKRVFRIVWGAPDARRRVNHGAQFGGRLVRSVFLDEGGYDRKDHHRGDDDGGADVPRKIGNGRQGEQQRVQRIAGAAP